MALQYSFELVATEKNQFKVNKLVEHLLQWIWSSHFKLIELV